MTIKQLTVMQEATEEHRPALQIQMFIHPDRIEEIETRGRINDTHSQVRWMHIDGNSDICARNQTSWMCP